DLLHDLLGQAPPGFEDGAPLVLPVEAVALAELLQMLFLADDHGSSSSDGSMAGAGSASDRKSIAAGGFGHAGCDRVSQPPPGAPGQAGERRRSLSRARRGRRPATRTPSRIRRSS